MHFTLRQKLLAVGDDFEAFDENGNLVYYFDGKVLSLGNRVGNLITAVHSRT